MKITYRINYTANYRENIPFSRTGELSEERLEDILRTYFNLKRGGSSVRVESVSIEGIEL